MRGVETDEMEDGHRVLEMECYSCGRVYRQIGESETWSAPNKTLNAEAFPGKLKDLLLEG